MRLIPIAASVAIALTFSPLSFAQGSWKDAFKKQAKDAAQEKAAEEFALPTAPAEGAKVYLIAPKNGEKVTNPVKVIFGLSGMGVAPAGTNVAKTGHHHLIINNPSLDYTRSLPATDQVIHFGGGQTETTVTLPTGLHTLRLLLADWKHQPFAPSVESETITIEVIPEK